VGDSVLIGIGVGVSVEGIGVGVSVEGVSVLIGVELAGVGIGDSLGADVLLGIRTIASKHVL
jgi:hypothetical protein